MSAHNIGPVVFYEHVYYFKEAFPGMPVRVSLEFIGMSKDGMFFEFRHNFYDHKGKNFARCEMMGAWIDLKKENLRVCRINSLKHLNRWKKPKTLRF